MAVPLLNSDNLRLSFSHRPWWPALEFYLHGDTEGMTQNMDQHTSGSIHAASWLLALSLPMMGCSAAQAPSAGKQAVVQPAAAIVDTNTAAAKIVGNISSSHSEGKALVKQCGALEVALQCNASSTDCTQTDLSIRDAAGKSIAVAKPGEMVDYTAVGLDCAIASDKSHYFVVQYGERPYGCGFCEWYYLYDATGKQLTHSDPIFLSDSSLPEGKQQTPNNREFDAALDRLGIKEVNTELFDRP